MEEIWKDIEGYEGLYQVSNIGRVKSLSRLHKNRFSSYATKDTILKPRKNGHGYLTVALYDANRIRHDFRVNRLVANAFINNEKDCPVVMHINNIKTDNRVDNLKWGTYRENTIQAEHDGLIVHKPIWLGKTRGNHPASKRIKMFKDGKYLRDFESVRSALSFIGKPVTSSNITACLKGITLTAYGYEWRYSDE